MLPLERIAEISDPSFVPRRTLTVQEAATWLGGVSDDTIRRLFDGGQLAGYKVGDKRLIYADSIEEHKDQNSNRPAPALPSLLTPGRRKPSRPATTDTINYRYL